MSEITKQQRADLVNGLVRFIGSRGRRFFWSNDKERFCRMEVDDRGRIWWIDGYTGKRIYTHYDGRWRGFTNGGTLRALVCAMRDYVRTGKPINPNYFGPWQDSFCHGDLWGYGKDVMAEIRSEAISSGVAREPIP